MESRRSFLKKGVITAYFITFAGEVKNLFAKKKKMKTNTPKKALVLWFSQTGHTERIGKLIAHKLKKHKIDVTSGDHRDIDIKTLPNYDLIVIGTPVYYYEPPITLTKWLKKIPEIKEISAASFSTFGGPGHNQHNSACDLLELLEEKGAIPIGVNTFGNMSTFAPTWSSGRIERIIKYKNRPNKETYQKAKKFADNIVDAIKNNRSWKIDFECSIFTPLKYAGTAWWTKKITIGKHIIDKKLCIECLECERKCPPKVIDISKHSIDNDKCILCMGCVNICPVQAHDMTFMGKKVYGFNEFLKRQKITITEPEEFSIK